jgi:hypothetical protein
MKLDREISADFAEERERYRQNRKLEDEVHERRLQHQSWQ